MGAHRWPEGGVEVDRTDLTIQEASSSAPAAPPAWIAETSTGDEDISLVSDYEVFAWNQTFTLVEPLPAPEFLELLNVIIERERNPEIRVRAMRMAAGIAEWCHDRY